MTTVQIPSFSDAALASINARFRDASVAELLGWATAHIPGAIRLACAFNAEDCLLVHAIAKAKLPISVFTLDTGLLFDETYSLADQLEARTGVHIERITPNETVQEQQTRLGSELWAHAPDRCCELRKVTPLRETLAPLGAWVTGIRREQTAFRRHTELVERDSQFGLLKLNPLAHWTEERVWQQINQEHVPYNALHDRGYPSIGCAPCTHAVAPGDDPRSGRWRQHEKTECGLHVAASAEPNAREAEVRS